MGVIQVSASVSDIEVLRHSGSPISVRQFMNRLLDEVRWKAHVHGMVPDFKVIGHTSPIDGVSTVRAFGPQKQTVGWDADGRPTEEWP